MRTHEAFRTPMDGSDSDSLDDFVDGDGIQVIHVENHHSDSDGDVSVHYISTDTSEFDPNAEDSDDSDDILDDEDIEICNSATQTAVDDEKPSGSAGTSAVDDLNEDEEDETVRAIIAAIKKPRTSPPEIKLSDYITDISFHPDNDIIALATILGDVHLYKYSNEENTKVQSIEVHTKACRDIEFSDDGLYLFSCSKDKTVMVTDVQTEKLKKLYVDAHDEAVNKLYIIDENLFTTGDDTGTVKLWDQRISNPVFELKEVEDYISAMLTNDAKKLLLVTSGDGYLTTINIATRKLFVQSEPYDEELTCMGLYRNDSKLVVGTSKGRLYTYNWGQFGYHCNMYPGIKTPISEMIPVTDRIGCVAGEEGIIRATHIAPHRNLGIVGQHTLPIVALDISSSGELIASASDNNDVRFWNVKYFEDFGEIKYNEKHNKHKDNHHNLPSSKVANASDFFADMGKTTNDDD